MVTYLEQFISTGFQQVLGNNIWIGMVFVGFFVAFVLMQKSSMESKAVILIPVSMLAIIFIPWLFIIVGLVCGFLVMGAIQKLQQQ